MGHPLHIVLRGAALFLLAVVGGCTAARAAHSAVLDRVGRLGASLETAGGAPEALSAVTLLAATAALALAWLWLLACIASCVLEELRRPRSTSVRRAPSVLRPRLVRLLVGGVAGSAVALTAVPASADGTSSDVDPIVVAGLLLPDRPPGAPARPDVVQPAPVPPPAAPDQPAPPATPDRPAPPVTGRVTITAGDTLWELAAELLPPEATDAAIDRAWRSIHQANRTVIGSDPHLIVPGTVLTVPDRALPSDPTPTTRGDRP